MKSAKYKDMSEEELRREDKELAEQLFKLRFQLAIGQVENPQRIRATRRDLARVKTRLRQIEIEAEAAGKAGR